MIMADLSTVDIQVLRNAYGESLRVGEPLARYTAARLGGPADALLEVRSSAELAEVVRFCWRQDLPITIIGGGSNILVSDAGVRGLVVLNRARKTQFYDHAVPPQVWAESGTNFGSLARQAAQRGFSGLEWAAGIPGTLGGAIVGNAGAHGGDIAESLLLAEILHLTGYGKDVQIVEEKWPVERFDYAYRNSALKRTPGRVVVLAAVLRLGVSTLLDTQTKMDEYSDYRKSTQPPGASMGSMFKNPPGDFAGRLIEAAGLKGIRIGDAEISSVHANFFVNLGQATASDIFKLLQLAQETVLKRFDVELELEIELVGEW